MPSKWCPDCQDVVTCSFMPSFCCWCGRDLRDDEVLPNIKTYAERLKLIEDLKKRNPNIKTDSVGQIKLF